MGQRLREERQRLKLSQTALAEKLKITRATQINYETSKRSPTGEYLQRFGKLGGDVGYVVMGERSTVENAWGIATCLLLPYILDRVAVNYEAALGILALGAEDEAQKSRVGSENVGLDSGKFKQLIDALFENGALLGAIFNELGKLQVNAKVCPSFRARADLVLRVYQASVKRGRMERKVLETAFRFACDMSLAK